MNAKPKHRRLRYSLRTMLVVVLVLSVWLGWMANRAAKQRRAVDEIRELGGQVYYDYERDENDAEIRIPRPVPPGPAWLRKLVGTDWLADVIVVRLRDVTDKELALLEDLPGLKRLFIRGRNVTDAGLAHLGTLDKLDYLEVEKFDISDDGLQQLSGLKNLEFLVLRDIGVTDAGLDHLESLSGLERLYLERTQVTAEGVNRIGQAMPDVRVDFYR